MGSRRTQNAEVVQFNPWILQCIQSPRPNSKRKALLWNMAGMTVLRRDGPSQFISHSTSSAVGIDRTTPIRIICSTEPPSDGIVLAANNLAIRVAIPGCDDATEFWCWRGKWISENREPVKLQFLARRNHHNHPLTRACLPSERRKHRLYLVPERRALHRPESLLRRRL